MTAIIELESELALKVFAISIRRARVWARKHFNADQCLREELIDENLNLLPPSFFVSFPTPDTMTVQPSIMGSPSPSIIISYRLHFSTGGKMTWKDIHGHSPPLVVEEFLL